MHLKILDSSEINHTGGVPYSVSISARNVLSRSCTTLVLSGLGNPVKFFIHSLVLGPQLCAPIPITPLRLD